MVRQYLSQTNKKCYSVLQWLMWLFLPLFISSTHSPGGPLLLPPWQRCQWWRRWRRWDAAADGSGNPRQTTRRSEEEPGTMLHARGCASLEEPGMLRWRVLVRSGSSMGKGDPNWSRRDKRRQQAGMRHRSTDPSEPSQSRTTKQ